MRAMRTYMTFLLACMAVAGLAIPWYFNIAFVLDGGSFAPAPFLAAVSANKLTAGITWDVYLAATAFSVWLLDDAADSGVRRPWIFVLMTFAVGLAFTLPLYLAFRKTSAA